jgi:murein DD-endopeptidase MepM/ murein hydrolase activator NlpD
MALLAILTTVAGRVTDFTPSTSRTQIQAVPETSSGYLRPPVLLTTVPSVLARHQAEVQATQSPETPGAADTMGPTDPAAATSAPAPAYFTYTVQPGDTIYSVAAAFGVSADYIIWNNPGVLNGNADLLVTGATLLIPSSDSIIYTVVLGDSLNGIADYHSANIDAIMAANGLTTPDSITPGMVLVVPGGSPAAPPPAAVAAVEESPEEPAAEPAAVYVPPEPEPVDEPPPPAAPSYGYVWPFYGIGVSTYFSGYHAGIDIDGFGMHGAPVGAAASGTVVLTSWDSWGYGYHVIIAHDDGSRTLYAHLSDIWVSQGSYVGQGQGIGAVGSTGYSTGTHLHFELHIGGPVDPLGYLP